MSKRQYKKLRQQLELEKRAADRMEKELKQAVQQKKEQMRKQQKEEQRRKKDEEDKAKEKARQRQKQQEAARKREQEQARRQQEWRKEQKEQKQRKEHTQRQHPKCTAQPSPKPNVAEGMLQHQGKWDAWVSSLPRPDAAESVPLPHPKLFAMHLASQARSAQPQVAYRQLMRTYHPDKFNQTVGCRLTSQQKDQLYPHVEELSKRINTMFGK